VEAGVRWTSTNSGPTAEQALRLAQRKMKTSIAGLQATREGEFEILSFYSAEATLMWFQQELCVFLAQEFGVSAEWMRMDQASGRFITHEEYYGRIVDSLPSVHKELRHTTLYFQG